MFRTIAPLHALSPLRSSHWLWAVALILGGSFDADALEPAVNYMLNCMGCHTPDGRGEPNRVPSVRDSLTLLSGSPEGRRFLVQVPGSAQSRLSNEELAEVLNWMVLNLSNQPAPERFKRFDAQEVAAYRRTPLVGVTAARSKVIADLTAQRTRK